MTVVIDRTGSNSAGGGETSPPAGGGHGPGLYQKRKAIYPKLVHGSFRRLKWALMAVMLAIYYGTPWIRWPRPAGAPDQAVLIDFAHGRFYFFMFDLWPDEVYFITGLLVLAALGLFLTTAVLGRLWCGYACPQTVWTDLYLYVERLFEGDRNARMRLAKAGWGPDRILRKGGKHLVWLAIAAATGGAWIFYFEDAPTLFREFFAGDASVTAYFSFALLTFTTYTLAGTLREQVCIYMCPWPRIQGAMVDRHSLQVTYRHDRGEPRGSHRKGDSWAGRGDCIDCNACVVACPMGIDIRDGAQLECINCALCIDACDEIMVKVERPTGLIGYDSDEAVSRRASGKIAIYRPVRVRTVFYALALLVVVAIMSWGFLQRTPYQLHVARDRNPLFVRLSDGSIRNSYTVKVVNRSYQLRTFRVTLAGVPVVRLQSPGLNPDPGGVNVTVASGEERSVRVLATVRAGRLAAALTPAVVSATVDDAEAPVRTLTARTMFVSDGASR
jgi:cytochrome c oxidase accessory protein FixG